MPASIHRKLLDHCNQARPFAYGSYALFGAAGALGIVGTALLFSSPNAAPAEPPSSDVALVPLDAGAAFIASGRF